MSFEITRWSRQSVALNTGQVIVDSTDYNGPALFTYASETDTAATIEAANYFAEAVFDLAVNDLIFAWGTDAFTAVAVDAIDREAGTVSVVSVGLNDSIATANIDNLAVTTAKLAADAVTNAKLADDAVSLENLDTGITPSHVVRFAGKENDGGGSATIAITVSGVVAADLAFAQVEASTNAVEVQKVTPSADTVTVLLSGDPGAATVISYQVLNAAS